MKLFSMLLPMCNVSRISAWTNTAMRQETFCFYFVCLFECVYTFWHPADTKTSLFSQFIFCVRAKVCFVALAFVSYLVCIPLTFHLYRFALVFAIPHPFSLVSPHHHPIGWIFSFVFFLALLYFCVYVLTIHTHTFTHRSRWYASHRWKKNTIFSRQIAKKTRSLRYEVLKKEQNAREQ